MDFGPSETSEAGDLPVDFVAVIVASLVIVFDLGLIQGLDEAAYIVGESTGDGTKPWRRD